MKFYHLLLALLFVALGVSATRAQKSVVWNSPTTEFGNCYGDGFFKIAMDITRVELKADETIVSLTAQLRSDYPNFTFRFANDTYLLADGKRYRVVSADGLQLGKYRQTNADGKLDIVFHFNPLPKDTKYFDLIEGDGDRAFQIRGVKPVEGRWSQLYPSYWRDERTGEWALALLSDCVVYNNQFWTYKTKPIADKATAKQTFIISNGKEDALVALGKLSKGKRTIQIDDKKIAASMITTRFLPDYPTKDVRTNFVDTKYKTDTATIVGWLKDMPEDSKKEKFFDILIADFITDESIEHNAKLDSIGRFCIKVPLRNSSGASCDWGRCYLRTVLEPGKKYFLLYDFTEGRRLMMGDDVRLQNELLKYPLSWSIDGMERDEQLDNYIDKVDSAINATYANIDSLCLHHPTLSNRFIQYAKEEYLAMSACNVGQSRFSAPNMRLTERAKNYAREHFWSKMSEPYSMHSAWKLFTIDYIDDILRDAQSSLQINSIDYLSEIASNEEEAAFARNFSKNIKEANDRIKAAKDADEKKLMEEAEKQFSEMMTKANAMLNSERGRSIIGEKVFPIRLSHELAVLDSFGATPIIKKSHIIMQTLKMLDYTRQPLSKSLIDTLAAMTADGELFQSIADKNNYYIALACKNVDSLVFKSSNIVEGMKEGEDILKKITEPYRGKYVLLDVWGTWCGPCKDALSHSKEEYERLAKYNLQYLYLANNSPKETWQTVIKEYDITGDNVAHYNLPNEQQIAIERYIGLHSYPTYKLIDPQGRLLDVKVDPRNLDATDRLLKQLIGDGETK